MSLKKKKALAIFAFLLFLAACGTSGFLNAKWHQDHLLYKGDVYEPLTFNQDIFYYDFCGTDTYIEEDENFPIEGGAYKLVYRDGDVYCVQNQVKDANVFYADDSNYHWQLIVWNEKIDEEKTLEVTLSQDELDYLSSIEKQDKDLALFFDEIELQGTLKKTSSDGIIIGITDLAYYEGQWYWRSEIIDENQEKDGTWPEYVYPMPESFQKKVKL